MIKLSSLLLLATASLSQASNGTNCRGEKSELSIEANHSEKDVHFFLAHLTYLDQRHELGCRDDRDLLPNRGGDFLTKRLYECFSVDDSPTTFAASIKGYRDTNASNEVFGTLSQVNKTGGKDLLDTLHCD